MRVIIKKDYEECSVWAANHIADAIKKFNPDEEKPFVIGLPTGSTPLGIYAKLAEKCRAKGLSFKNVISFNMDEYVGLAPDNENSYRYFMNRNFFDLIDINKANTHLLDGCAADLEAECENFEKMIAESGGIKLFLGGIGNDGHLAFNEPGSSLTGRTHVQLLTEDTRSVNSRFFGGDISKVPEKALTVGTGTICDAEEVLIIASGRAKACAVAAAVEGCVSQVWPVSVLQLHKNAVIVCDEAAAEELRFKTVKYFMEMENSGAEASFN